jgi:hypothetical protein
MDIPRDETSNPPPSRRARLRRIILNSLLALATIGLIVELVYRDALPGMFAGVSIVSTVRDQEPAPPLPGGPPLSPAGTAQRIALMDQLRSIPGFYERVAGPATIVAYQQHDIPTILAALSTEAEEEPGTFSLKAAALTSYFKHAGISGWDDAGHDVVVEGAIDQHEPSLGDDHMLTIDLSLRRLVVDGEDVSARIAGQRFIRIEVFGATVTQLSERPHLGQCLRVQGPLRVDNDREGFYEVHPREAAQLEIVDCQAQGGARKGGSL